MECNILHFETLLFHDFVTVCYMDLCTAMLHGWSLYSHVTWVVSVQPCYMGGLCTAMLHGRSLYTYIYYTGHTPRLMAGFLTAVGAAVARGLLGISFLAVCLRRGGVKGTRSTAAAWSTGLDRAPGVNSGDACGEIRIK